MTGVLDQLAVRFLRNSGEASSNTSGGSLIENGCVWFTVRVHSQMVNNQGCFDLFDVAEPGYVRLKYICR